MKLEIQTAVLFDMDGVVLDTESQYSVFWDKTGREALGIEHFDSLIKGTTNTQIGEKYFQGREEEFARIVEANRAWEAEMTYNYFPGVVDFINDLRANGVKLALVTSSDEAKMACVYRAHPEMKELFDLILSAGSFTRSKPHPECFLLAMKQLNVTSANSFVIEDSFHGLAAGRASGATVIGMATTNSREGIEDKADYVLDSFLGMTYQKLISLHNI
ncbi:HAD family phosphatase [Bacteroides sp. 214]|uniref:HAD family hydrolase n=1 Tax=Bacteroides sp. 214 TaxID=2302935 RepID=UPI0013D1CF2A|nr:HAD family phosphatase [Bacteroides sp. 214]NDW11945.1 HAD family phosphatase [Bacteroides sp. 214]